MLSNDSHLPLPWILVQSLVVQAIGYFSVVGALFMIVWRWGRERFRHSRIPAPSRFDTKQLRREIAHTFVTFIAGSSSAGVVVALHANGMTRLRTGDTPVWLTLTWSLVFLVFNDAWFYGWHRLLHTPWFFRHVHSVHHKSVDVNPFTSYSFHAFEAFILGIWIVPVAVFLPLPMTALGLLQVIGLANNVMSHLGYEFLPRWLMRVPGLRWINTATFHSLHHTQLTGNYGLHTRLWDRVFGTEVEGYERAFVTRGDGNTKDPTNNPAVAE